MLINEYLTPKRIVEELDKYIIGQYQAKRCVAIALSIRWRRQQISGDIKGEIMPNNIILIGPTGIGKTEIARRISRLTNAPFIKVEASKFTEVGYVGRDVESMVRELMNYAVSQVREAMIEEVRPEAEKNATEMILDILLPRSKKMKQNANNTDTPEYERYLRSREKCAKNCFPVAWMKRKLKLNLKQITFPILRFFRDRDWNYWILTSAKCFPIFFKGKEHPGKSKPLCILLGNAMWKTKLTV